MRTLRRAHTLCALLLLASAAGRGTAQEATQIIGRFTTGRDDRGIGIPGVSVSALDANEQVSDKFGRFRLAFSKRKPGDEVQLVYSYEKWELVNNWSLPYVLRSQVPPPELNLVLSPPEEVAKKRETYYAAPAIRKYEAEFKKAAVAAEQTRVTGRISQQEYATQIKLLEDERDQKIEVAKEAARQLTVVPVKSQGKEFRRAVEAFGNGNVDDARNIIKSPSFGKIVSNTSAMPAAPWVFRAQMEELGGDRQAAESSLRKAAVLEPGSLRVALSYGSFQARANQTNLARAQFEQALKAARQNGNNLVAAQALGGLGKLSQSQNDLLSSRDQLTQSLELWKLTAKHGKFDASRDIAHMYDELGTTELKANRLNEALVNYGQALKIYKKLDEQNQLLNRQRLPAVEAMIVDVPR